MAKSKTKTIFVCQNCSARRPRWEGKCTECGSWNSFVEEIIEDSKKIARPGRTQGSDASTTFSLDEYSKKLDVHDQIRIHSGIEELDRVLGGGLIRGSFCLLAGDPGIGKSTLLLQMAAGLARKNSKVLYVSAEESIPQTSQRAQRLGINHPNIKLGSESNLEVISEWTLKERPHVLVIDSIQTVHRPELQSAPGSVSQVRESASFLMNLAKGYNISVILVGHVTKDGSIAGPKVLEHLVDTVLSFEGDPNHMYRLLRSVKNRFGPTHELGIFQMNSMGLREVKNPSEMFLEERSERPVGSVVFASMEGTRPLLCEVQALTVETPMAMPRRTAIGFDTNRVHLLVAVLDRHTGLEFSKSDVFVNVVGGLKLIEPAADLAVAAAMISSYHALEIEPESAFFGEVGLTGEVRGVPFVEARLKEAHKLGFKEFVIPYANKKHLTDLDPKILKGIVWIKHVEELLRYLKRPLQQKKKQSAQSTPLSSGEKFLE